MKLSGYLVIKKNGYRGSFRAVKTSPSLEYNEVAIRINLDIPDEVFSKPQFEASISVPKDAVNAPVIEANIVNNIESIIKQQTGFEVKLSLVSVEDEE